MNNQNKNSTKKNQGKSKVNAVKNTAKSNKGFQSDVNNEATNKFNSSANSSNPVENYTNVELNQQVSAASYDTGKKQQPISKDDVKPNYAGVAGSTNPSGDNAQSSHQKIASSASSKSSLGDFESIALQKGDTSNDPSVTNVGDKLYYNLEVLHANYEGDPQQSRSGFDTLVRFSQIDKRAKVRLSNKVSDGQYGIANSSKTIVRDAKRRATGDNIKEYNGLNHITYPDLVNFVTSFNVSGHIPLPKFGRVQEWELNDVYRLVPKTIVNNSDRKLKFIKIKDIRKDVETDNLAFSSQETADLKAKGLGMSPNSLLSVKDYLDTEFTEFPYSFNKWDGDSIYKDSFNNDVDTSNYFLDFAKIFTVLNDHTLSTGNNIIPQVIKTKDFIYSKILADVDFATLLFIMLDSIDHNFGWHNVVSNKIGIVDSTVRSFQNQRASILMDGRDRIKSLYKVFEYIPVNGNVISSWNAIKNASQIGSSDLYDEGNISLIPHFQILGDFFKVDGIKSAEVSASAVAPLIQVPLTNLGYELLSRITKVWNEGTVPNSNSNKWVTGKGKKSDPVGNSTATSDSIVSISAVRMTNFMFNALHSFAFRDDIHLFLDSYFKEFSDYYKLINDVGCFKDTRFIFTKPRMIDFKTAPEVNFIDNGVHKFALSSVFPSINGVSTAPFLTNDMVNLAKDLDHYITYNEYSDETSIQKFIKAFVVDSIPSNNHSTDANGLSSLNFNSNLQSINLLGSIIVPFIASDSHVFSMNVVPVSASNKIIFTKGSNQELNECAFLFEFSAWNNPLSMKTNDSDTRPHIANVRIAENYYLCSDNMKAFHGNSTSLRKRLLISELFNFIPKPQFIHDSYNHSVALDGLFGWEAPDYTTYTPMWATVPFGSTSLSEFSAAGDKYIEIDDLSLSNSKIR